MKTILSLVTAGLLASATAGAAQQIMVVPSDQIPGLTTATGKYTVLYPKRPDWTFEIDRSILHPVPKPFPWPGPGCLSCPPFGLDERVTTPRQILR